VDKRAEIRVKAVGDIMMGDHPIRIGHGVRAVVQAEGSKYLFQQVAHLLQGGDVVFGNLETPISSEGLVESCLESVQLRASPDCIEGVRFAGFNALSVANNHAMEHGSRAFLDTVSLLKSNGILPLGERSAARTKCKPVVFQKVGLSVCLVAYSLVPDTHDRRQLLYSFSNEEQILAQVEEVREDHDVVLVSLHWGHEFMNYPSPRQILFAHSLIDRGASVILGHHPHVLQSVEHYGDGIIAYSLGNFVFDMLQLPTRQSVILSCTITREGVRDVAIDPIMIQAFRPTPARGKSRDAIESLLTDLSWMPDPLHASDSQTSLYRRRAVKARRGYRRDSRRYFLRNLARYDPWLAFQLVASRVCEAFARLGRRGIH
jgi:poly-gamma-glutamate synthesis protein (capsule biosynthesis protein)